MKSNNQIKDLLLLAACLALSVTSNSLHYSVASLAGRKMTDYASLATLPTVLVLLMGTLLTMPLSLFMERFGRRLGFQLASLSNVAGGLLSAHAIYTGSFLQLCLASVFVGVGYASFPYYRFAGIDIAGKDRASFAMGLVLIGGVVAAILGPNLARWTIGVMSMRFAGNFVATAIIALIIISLMALIRFPPMPRASKQSSAQVTLKGLLSRPKLRLALLAGVVSYASMVFLMMSMPMAMEDHSFQFDSIALIIQWHLLAMYAPSILTGKLIARFGALPMLFMGMAMLLGSALMGQAGHSHGLFLGNMILLGLGWNLGYLAAASLLTESHGPEETAKAQGLNELCVQSSVTFAALFAGGFYEHAGWIMANWFVLPWVGLVALMAVRFLLGERKRLARA